ncbi:MAG: GIY-YIG nuclease family protein [Chitinophagales bacterium]|nr:GIY-YIG nuclease family protein [Chitinophagales bacterium]
MFTVYVLFSRQYHKTYTGFTSDLMARLKSHNELGTKDWAIRYRPWEVLITEEYDNKKHAMQREKFLKSGVGREFIHSLIRKKYQD